MPENARTAQARGAVDAWVAAEEAGDTTALGAMLTEDFAGIGPHGFQLDRGGWLDRHDSGSLVNEVFTADEIAVRHYGAETAIANGVLAQRATYRGRPVPGRFRFTAALIADGHSWRIANLQLSPMPGN
ncbi:nuclear transport factor 2 family protein [Nocardiopsis halotolerans]|uniref:nuclear transport factor 2 family protein n=1 Tax=Nocardiopsis halotolerans TaxID=124252 RepID=UPI00034754B6|nr:nuclear transport factor 2 family protein [Nocardiopsis halotolerans]